MSACYRHPDKDATHLLDRGDRMVEDPEFFPVDGVTTKPAEPLPLCTGCADALTAYADTLTDKERDAANALVTRMDV